MKKYEKMLVIEMIGFFTCVLISVLFSVTNPIALWCEIALGTISVALFYLPIRIGSFLLFKKSRNEYIRRKLSITLIILFGLAIFTPFGRLFMDYGVFAYLIYVAVEFAFGFMRGVVEKRIK